MAAVSHMELPRAIIHLSDRISLSVSPLLQESACIVLSRRRLFLAENDVVIVFLAAGQGATLPFQTCQSSRGS